jgi:hypothetical protein
VAAHVSLVAVCAAESAAALIFAPINLVIVVRLTRIPLRAVLSVLSVPALGLVAFSAVAVASKPFTGGLVGEPSLGSLIVLVLPPVSAFALAVILRRPRILAEGREILATALGNKIRL